MSSWRNIMAAISDDAEVAFARLSRQLDDRIGREPLAITPYRGYGRADQIVLRGRVLEHSRATVASDSDSVWRNLLNIYRRFETDEVPFARLRARFAGAEQEIEADREGFFELRMAPAQPLSTNTAWHAVELTLLAPASPDCATVQATGEVFVPQPGARVGVISDIDDTVVKTDAASLTRMARNVFLSNARSRLIFPGVAALYRALQAGPPGPFVDPIFYVSSSPWNIYDMLVDFFELRGLPKGAMFLRDWGITPERLPFGHRAHKLAAISEVLEFYPDLSFILIGDSGQEDPEIYSEAVRRYPKRISALYIRSVDTTATRIAAITQLTEQVIATGSALVLADDTIAMARHAAEQGYITAEALAEVAADRAAETTAQSTVEALLDEAEAIDTASLDQAATQVATQVADAKATGTPPTIIVDGDGAT
ncbi:MAG: DUF2183 domain-containing protein [Roseiflexaceae bacterium]|nr:DUF2183 domain-containing protein [Roseiflexaceae bacterium]